MPNLTEANVLLIGRVIGVESLTQYDNETQKQTDKPDGVRILVNSVFGSYGNVKIPQAALEAGTVEVPEFGQPVAWIVRYGAYAGRNGGANFTSFQRIANVGELDQALSVAASAPSPAAAK